MTLTEQWKKGELSDGMYYMENASGIIGIVGHSKAFPCYNVKQVLAEVPTYEEYLESEAHCAVYSEVNKQLRTLLKECKEYLSDVDTYCTKNADESYLLITRINAAISESEE